jgi:glutathione synthase
MQSEHPTILFIADEPAALNPTGDTSLALAEAALDAGFQVEWALPLGLALRGSQVVCQVEAQLAGFDKKQGEDSQTSTAPRWLGATSPPRPRPIADYAAVFVRKDPPFDAAFTNFCWLLALAFPGTQGCLDRNGQRMRCINSPAGLLTFHEKTVQFAALTAGAIRECDVLPALVTGDERLVEQSLELWNEGDGKVGYVIKPWLGYGGRGVTFARDSQTATQAWRDMSKSGLAILQPFDPRVRITGDIRIIVAGGIIVGSFARLPQADKVASNLAQGGTAQPYELTHSQRTMILNLLPFLQANGIGFAGIDMIGDRINEINITSPTGLRTLQALGDREAPSRAFAALMAIR